MNKTKFTPGRLLFYALNLNFVFFYPLEHLKACVDVASSRTANWQKFCVKHAQVLPFLMQISFKLDDGVNPIVLQLLQSAICNVTPTGASTTVATTSTRKRAFR